MLLDAFHLMNRYKVSQTHHLYRSFMKYLRSAIFLVDPLDLQKVKENLAAKYPRNGIKKLFANYYILNGKVKR